MEDADDLLLLTAAACGDCFICTGLRVLGCAVHIMKCRELTPFVCAGHNVRGLFVG